MSVADKVIERLKRLSRQIESGESIQAVRIKADGSREEFTIEGKLHPDRWLPGMWGVSAYDDWECVVAAFPTRKAAIDAAVDVLTRRSGSAPKEFYLCKFEPVELRTGSLADTVLEQCEENTFEGWEDPDGFDFLPDAEEELESTLTAVVTAWVKRHGLLDECFVYGDMERIVVADL